jgi:hypothetical protein
LGIASERSSEPGEDQLNHMQLFNLASEGGEEGGLGGLQEGETGVYLVSSHIQTLYPLCGVREEGGFLMIVRARTGEDQVSHMQI